jgi:D-alanine-D-alanine ligase
VNIGLTFNVRSEAAGPGDSSGWDDAEEEFDSPETINALAEAIRAMGHEVELLGEGEPLLRRLLDGPRPDLVFNLAEGRGIGRSREARVPAVLEMLDIPYTGSDPLTLAATLDKDCAKRLVRAAGVPTPDWLLFDPASDDGSINDAALSRRLAGLPLPVIVKPAFEGSSKGIFNASLIHERAQLVETVGRLHESYSQPVLVEEFIDGDELTVGLVGNSPPEVLGVMRVVPNSCDGPFVYGLEVKRDWARQVRYECPAQISIANTRSVREGALAAWRALGCRDLARIDFRLRHGVPYFLEANPLPGLNPSSSDLVLMGRQLNIDYPQLVARIVQAAVDRLGAATVLSSGFRVPS